MILSQEEKDEIARRSRADLEEALGPAPEGLGACLHATHFLLAELRRREIAGLVQAGSLSWPIIPPEEDDGECVTHFAYEWSPDSPESVASMSEGNLPEIHVWASIRDSREIVDISTSGLREQCQRFGIVEWRTPDPPEYVWSSDPFEQFGAIYIPDPEATGFAIRCLWMLYQPGYLTELQPLFLKER